MVEAFMIPILEEVSQGIVLRAVDPSEILRWPAENLPENAASRDFHESLPPETQLIEDL
jgi:hypothetical protein